MLVEPLTAAAAELTEILNIPIVFDSRDLSLPGGILAIDRISRTLGGSFELGVDLWIVTGDAAAPAVLDQLGRILETLTLQLGDAVADELEPTSIHLPALAPDPLPAIRIPITLQSIPKGPHHDN